MPVRLLRRVAVATALGMALALGACGGGEDEIKAATPAPGTTATVVPANPKAAAAATAQTRAIGAPQNGTIPVWLTGYAILPWIDQVPQPGRHTFTVSNRGTQKHSLAIIQFNGDPRTLPRSGNLIATTQVTIAGQTDVIEPGRELDFALNLEAGRYVLTSMFGQDYADGMAAAFSVGGANPGTPLPKQPPDGGLGLYMTENGAFASNGQVRGGRLKVTVQNLGSKPREFAIIRWRGLEDTLPTSGGVILLDGLQEVHRFETILAGENREIEVDLQGGFSYVLASLAKGEYEQGIRTQVKVN